VNHGSEPRSGQKWAWPGKKNLQHTQTHKNILYKHVYQKLQKQQNQIQSHEDLKRLFFKIRHYQAEASIKNWLPHN